MAKEITDGGGKALFAELDVTHQDQWDAAVVQVRETFGALNILMNIVGSNDLVMLPDGPIKTFTLRGIKDSPPYLHDGRLLTLADTVEFFNLVLGVKLTQPEKDALVAYMLTL